MRLILTTITALLFLTTSYAQKDNDPLKWYKEFEISSNGDIKLISNNPLAKSNYCKFELRIQNNSKEFVYFYPNKCVFRYADGEYSPKAKNAVVVHPGDERSPTLKVEGGKKFLVNEFEFIPGGFFTFDNEGTPTEAPDYRLPAEKNDFKAGNFKVQLLKLKKETAETAVQFEVTYTGDKIALVSPSKAVVRTEDGTEWANARSHEKPDVLERNDKCKFTLLFHIPGKITDMQFAIMHIVWKSVFAEVDLKPIEFQPGTFVIDEAKMSQINTK
jgi:hypothetical protein